MFVIEKMKIEPYGAIAVASYNVIHLALAKVGAVAMITLCAQGDTKYFHFATPSAHAQHTCQLVRLVTQPSD